MKYTALLLLLLLSVGSLGASHASKVIGGFDAEVAEKLAESYTQQGYTELTRDEFDAMRLSKNHSIDKFLAGKISTLVESKLEEIQIGEKTSWFQTQFIIVKVKNGSPRFFIKRSADKPSVGA